jgi:hypothetical protein
MADEIKKLDKDFKNSGLFINHTLLNREGNRLYFFARAGWGKWGNNTNKTNAAFSVHLDGSKLTRHEQHIGGHPEWGEGSLLIGREGEKQIFYDVDAKKVVKQLGSPEIFPVPQGDISLSPDGNWFANGYKNGSENVYTVYRLSDDQYVKSEGVYKGDFSGDIRIDPAPRWNRSSDAILVPGIDKNNTRQMFLIRVVQQ